MPLPILPLFGLLAGAASSIGGAVNAANERRRQIDRRAAEVRNSPWTGRTEFTKINPSIDPVSQGISGLVAGGQAASELGKWEQGGGWGTLFGDNKVEAPPVADQLQQPQMGAQFSGQEYAPSFMQDPSAKKSKWSLLSNLG
jgi:hypothetical protein